MLDEVDASDEQREQIESIVEEMALELRAAHQDGHPFEGFKAALTGSAVDREAIEALRAEKLTRLDATSRRVVDVMATVAEILTSEQREKLATLMEEHGSHRGGCRAHDRFGSHDRG
jgi:Spy/CpxP family protein refolding chaperone